MARIYHVLINLARVVDKDSDKLTSVLKFFDLYSREQEDFPILRVIFILQFYFEVPIFCCPKALLFVGVEIRIYSL